MKNESANKALQQARDNLARKGIQFQQCFASAAGEKTLEHLKEEFDPSTLCSVNDTTAITIKAAQRDVIKYIEMMINYKGVEGDVDKT